ncbi:MAG: hypothetical protein H0U13_11550 [Gemmatimonadaceae bacterium]|nr:hypothetical protein [Gemmatimonadaceae bacterium]
MPLTTQGRNDLLTNGATAWTHVSAMTDLGVTEISGSTRQAITWAAAASGIRDNAGAIAVPIAAGTTVMVGALYSALTAGNLEGWFQIGSTLRGVGTVVTIAGDAISSNGHGLANTNRVFVTTVAGEALPAGLSATTLYFVVGATTDTFQLSLTSGGAAVDITGLGDVAWFRTVPEGFTNAGNLNIAAGALDLDASFA